MGGCRGWCFRDADNCPTLSKVSIWDRHGFPADWASRGMKARVAAGACRLLSCVPLLLMRLLTTILRCARPLPQIEAHGQEAGAAAGRSRAAKHQQQHQQHQPAGDGKALDGMVSSRCSGVTVLESVGTSVWEPCVVLPTRVKHWKGIEFFSNDFCWNGRAQGDEGAAHGDHVGMRWHKPPACFVAC